MQQAHLPEFQSASEEPPNCVVSRFWLVFYLVQDHDDVAEWPSAKSLGNECCQVLE
jgi:hypothetical protein